MKDNPSCSWYVACGNGGHKVLKYPAVAGAARGGHSNMRRT